MPDVALVLGLLAAVAVLAAAGRRAALPGPVVFALGGLALALVPGVPSVGLPPPLVLVVFLPPLIFAAAQDTSWSELRENARPIALLAVGLVLATMAAVAVVARAVAPELPWAAAFTLGAVVAPPDAVAAKAVADTLHLPRRLVAVLEGEGLVNDATALVAFQIASGLAVAAPALAFGAGEASGGAAGGSVNGGALALAGAASRLAAAAAGGVAIGVAAGWVGRRVLRHAGDPAAEHVVTLLLPFAAFLPAEQVHASGVLAVVALALYLGRHGTAAGGAARRLEGRVLWDMLNFLLTGLSFVLVGLQLRSATAGLADRAAAWRAAGAVCLSVLVVRPAWVFAAAWASHAVRRVVAESGAGTSGAGPTPRPPAAVLGVLSWAGMRGVVSLAVALSIPATTADGRPFPGRALIVFVTFAVVLVTLVGQGLTLPAVIRRLGVGADANRADDQMLAAELRMARAALGGLDAAAVETGAPADVADEIRAAYADRVARRERARVLRGGDAAGGEAGRAREASARWDALRLRTPLLALEQAELQRLRAGPDLDAPVARRVQARLDARRLGEGDD